MKILTRVGGFALGCAVAAVAVADGSPGAAAADPGRAIFVERCASCHNERGDKPLKSGLPLSDRKLSEAKIAEVARQRLAKATEEERRAVARYIASIVQKP